MLLYIHKLSEDDVQMKRYVIQLVDGLFASKMGYTTDDWDKVQMFDTKDDAEREMYRIEDLEEAKDYNCEVRTIELSVKLM